MEGRPQTIVRRPRLFHFRGTRQIRRVEQGIAMNLAVILFVAALGARTSGAPDEQGQAGGMIMLDGRCDYASAPPATARQQRLDCKSAVLMPGRDPTDVLVQFVTGTDGVYGFSGPVSGDLLTIKRIYLPGPKVIPAEGGHCKIFFRNKEISGLSCVGDAPDAVYVANFLASAVHRVGS
jgi:hypothetical protein